MNEKQAIGLVVAGFGLYRMYKSSQAGADVATISSGQDITNEIGPLQFCANMPTQPGGTIYSGAMIVTATYARSYVNLFPVVHDKIYNIVFTGTADAPLTITVFLFSKNAGYYVSAGTIDIPAGTDAIQAAYKFNQAQLTLKGTTVEQSILRGSIVEWWWNYGSYSDDAPHPVQIEIIKK